MSFDLTRQKGPRPGPKKSVNKHQTIANGGSMEEGGVRVYTGLKHEGMGPVRVPGLTNNTGRRKAKR